MKPDILTENIQSAEQIVGAIEAFARGERCALKHEPGTEVPMANVVLTQAFGVGEKGEENVQIPLCEECAAWWSSEEESEWGVLFCVKCGESQWIFKPFFKREWRSGKVLWLAGCLRCGQAKSDKVWVR